MALKGLIRALKGLIRAFPVVCCILALKGFAKSINNKVFMGPALGNYFGESKVLKGLLRPL